VTKRPSSPLCVYCVVSKPDTWDHIFARQFLPVSRRGNLPKVPACKQCNNAKSRLEHYLAKVLPFGGRHGDAAANLSVDAPRRLAKNIALHRRLARERSTVLKRSSGGLLVRTIALTFDAQKLEQLIAYIVRGLVWHHWGVLLQPDTVVEVHSMTRQLQPIFASLSGSPSNARVTGDIGAGAFSYMGVQGNDNPQVTFWQFSIFGGLTLVGEPQSPAEEVSQFGVMTGPSHTFKSGHRKAKWLSGRIA
jgi:hypothetical protein